jgi:hypothetical protein
MPTISPTTTLTLTPTITLTSTYTPTFTSTVDQYPIDMSKSVMPDSEAILEANPGNFIEAPDPLTDINAFNTWWQNKYIPALGDRQKREPNFIIQAGIADVIWVGDSRESIDVGLGDKGAAFPLLNKPNFFYFKHEGIFYPVLVVTGNYHNSGEMLTNAVILYNEPDGNNPDNKGVGVIEQLSQGKLVLDITIWEKTDPVFPDSVNGLIRAGLVGFKDTVTIKTNKVVGVEHVPIGPGYIKIR